MIGTLSKAAFHAGRLLRLKASLSGGPSVFEGEPRKILLMGYTAIGDFVYLLPTIAAIRRKLPNATLVYLANPYPTTREILPASSLVDQVWELDGEKPSSSDWGAMKKRILDFRFDAVIASAPAPMKVLAPVVATIPIRIGHVRPIEAPHEGWSLSRYALWQLRRGLVTEEFDRRLLFNKPVPVKEDLEHTVDRNLRMIEGLGLSVDEKDREPAPLPEPQASKAFAEKALAPFAESKKIGVHIGSAVSQYGKIWPAERWGEALRRIADGLGARVFLFGGPEERNLPRLFEKGFKGPFTDFVGKLPILHTFALMRRLDHFLANDTGLAKASMSLGTPTTTLWGPSDRNGWGIYWDRDKHLEVYHELPCSPCVRMGLGREGAGVINFSNCGHRKCLAEMTPAEVAGAVLKKIGS